MGNNDFQRRELSTEGNFGGSAEWAPCFRTVLQTHSRMMLRGLMGKRAMGLGRRMGLGMGRRGVHAKVEGQLGTADFRIFFSVRAGPAAMAL